VRRLIINADDFGLTPGVNRGIIEAHGHGIVTSATLMANGAAFEDAVRLAQSSPRLSVGCHVVLVDGVPLLPASQVSSLVTGQDASGPRFRDGISGFAWRALTGQLHPEQIEAEAAAQIRKLQSAGLAVSHVDTHKHTHLFPGVLRPLLQAARECGVRAVRNPFEHLRLASVLSRPKLWIRGGAVVALRSLSRAFRRAVQQEGMITPDGIVGLVVTGALDEQLFRSITQSMPEGTWEFVCHPGYNDQRLQGVQTRLRESRARELQLLTSSETRDWLARVGIEWISYRDLL
jgi:hopanoid biosynthesis associated protein HpnK